MAVNDYLTCKKRCQSTILYLIDCKYISYATSAANRVAPHHVLQSVCLEAGDDGECARACIAATIRVQAAALWSKLTPEQRAFPSTANQLRLSLFSLVKIVCICL